MKNRALIAAGGTGGHFYPGLALGEALRQRGWEALFILREGDPARPRLESEGFPAVEIPLRGMPRGVRGWIKFIGGLIRSLRTCLRVLDDFKPDAVVGTGAYLSFPAILAARLRRKPRLVHESNVIPGLSARLCVFLGARLLRGLPGKGGVLVGTPIRATLREKKDRLGSRKALGLEPDLPTILIFGGSQGARGINSTVPGVLKNLSDQFPKRFQALHLCGKDESLVRAAYEGISAKIEIRPYLEAMDLAYGAADLVICRAGASTLAELCAQAKPAVLIPFPAAAQNHQALNAAFLEKAGAARVVLEKDIALKLPPLVESLIFSPEKLRSMQDAYGSLGLPDPAESAEKIAGILEAAAGISA